MEFTDGMHRGIYDSETESDGFPDEAFDATMAMVINWHRLPKSVPERDARLKYRQVHPDEINWQLADGESREFWYRVQR